MMSTGEPTLLSSLTGPGQDVADLLDALPAVVGVLRGADLVVELANPRFRDLAGGRPLLGRPAGEVFGQPENRPLLDLAEEVIATGEPRRGAEAPARVMGEDRGERPAWFDFVLLPLRGDSGVIEGVLVHAVEVSRQVQAREQLGESERRLRALVDANIVGVVIADGERTLEANDAMLRMVGADRAALEAGRVRWRDMTPPEWRANDERMMTTLVETGRVGPFEKELVGLDGRRLPVLLGAALLERDPFLCVAFMLDLSERRASERERERLLAREREARREAELAAGRIGRLQTVTAALSAAMSAEDVGRIVVAEAMAALGADAGLVADIGESEGVIGHAVGYEEDKLAAWSRFPLDELSPLGDAVRAGEPVLISDEKDWGGRYPALLEDPIEFPAFAGVPFVFHGRALGAMALSFRSPRVFTADDRGFLVALGRQAAQALERARLYEERAYVARTLQEGLLPSNLTPVPGLEVAVRYHSISDGGRVGGDFYDLFDIAGDRWLVAVGDVCGKGTAAAVLTGLSRHTLRAIAMREREPVAMLAFLNEALRRQATAPGFCTVSCATLTRIATGGFEASLASGGHPYPLLARAGGEGVEEVAVPGTLLGVEPVPRLDQVTLRLEPGDVLMLYTDGATDARSPGGEHFGEARLHAALAAARGGDADAIAEAVDEEVRAWEPARPRDDRAIVVLRVLPAAAPNGSR